MQKYKETADIYLQMYARDVQQQEVSNADVLSVITQTCDGKIFTNAAEMRKI